LTLDAPYLTAEKGTFDRIRGDARCCTICCASNVADSEIKAKCANLLKTGGMIGIEQHRAKADAPFSLSPMVQQGVPAWKADIIALHGTPTASTYRREQRSQCQSRKTPPTGPDGVWTLPPVLRWRQGRSRQRHAADRRLAKV
jgi:predicted methyltransferase